MHLGCFVWTPTPPLSGGRTPRPGPARVCVCVPFLAGSGRPASWARFGAPHLSFCRSCCALCLFGPLQAGVALFVVVVGVFCFPFPVAPSVSPALRVFRSGVPWAFASCCPPPPFFSFPCLCSLFFVFCFLRPRCPWRSVFSGPGVPWASAPCCPRPFFSLAFVFFLFLPSLFLAYRVFGPGYLGASAPCRSPPLVFFFLLPPSCFFVFSWFLGFSVVFFSGCAVWGGFVCLRLSAVPVCASVVLFPLLLFVRCPLAPQALAGVAWCCLLCLGVCFWAWLSSVVSWWVWVSFSGGAVLVWPRGSPPCGLAWCVLVFRCPVLCSVALCCRVVVCCRALLFVCVVACACCLFAAAARLLCVFCLPCPLLPVRCCAGALALCWYPCVVLSASSALFLVPVVIGSWCRCLLLRVCRWLWLPGIVVWWCVSALMPVSGLAVAGRLPCGVLLPCVVSCGAVLWCPVFFFRFFPCWWRWFSASPLKFPATPVKMVFRFEKN